MKIKLKQDQYYIAAKGGIYCGFKNDIIDVDPLFVKHIAGRYELALEGKEPEEKPLEKMNKNELIEKAKSLGIDLGDENFEKLTKADLIKTIQEVEKN